MPAVPSVKVGQPSPPSLKLGSGVVPQFPVSGVAAFTGSGSLGVVARGISRLGSVYSGSGQASFAAKAVESRLVEFVGAGNLVMLNGSETRYTGEGTLSFTARESFTRTAAFTGSGELGVKSYPKASAFFSGSGSADFGIVEVERRTADFAGDGTLSASGVLVAAPMGMNKNGTQTLGSRNTWTQLNTFTPRSGYPSTVITNNALVCSATASYTLNAQVTNNSSGPSVQIMVNGVAVATSTSSSTTVATVSVTRTLNQGDVVTMNAMAPSTTSSNRVIQAGSTFLYFDAVAVSPPSTAPTWPSGALGLTAVTLSTAPTDGNTLAANRAADFQQLSDLGVKYLRVLVQWPDTEYNQGSYDWTTTDTYINGAYDKGINLLACITYAPGWAQVAGQTGHGAPNNLTAWTNFVTAAATRYAGKVSKWEIWNEQNISASWSPTPSAAAYKPYLQAAYTALKGVSADNFVMTGGTAPTLSLNGQVSPPDFMTNLYAAGGKPYFDAVAFHPYDVPYQLSDPSSDQWRSQQHITGIRNAMVANGDSAKPMWFTEFGAATPTPAGSYGVSESEQSVLVADGIDYLRSLSYCGAIFVFDFRDTQTGTSNDQQNYGLYRTNRTAKPAASAFLTRNT